MDVSAYLQRIQIAQPESPTLDFLLRLQESHLYNVPFENLSVVYGQDIILEEDLLFEKIVGRGRGGFCYELNGLFSWLLRQLGYRLDRVSARVFNGDLGAFGQEFDHMALLVHLEETYLVDVGFGDSFRQPIAFPGGETSDVSGCYRIRKSGFRHVLERNPGQGWAPEFQFTTTPRRLNEYAPMCRFHQTSPESSFTQRRVCTRATPEGRITLTADSLTITSDGEKRKTPVDGERAFESLLFEYFGKLADDLSEEIRPG